MEVLEIANKICKHIPEYQVIKLCFENGAAWVELVDNDDNQIKLPDAADKTLEEQLNDALCVANGWFKIQ